MIHLHFLKQHTVYQLFHRKLNFGCRYIFRHVYTMSKIYMLILLFFKLNNGYKIFSRRLFCCSAMVNPSLMFICPKPQFFLLIHYLYQDNSHLSCAFYRIGLVFRVGCCIQNKSSKDHIISYLVPCKKVKKLPRCVPRTVLF